MSLMLALILLAVVLCFGYVLAFGAPYLPTLSPQVAEALRLIGLRSGQTLLELGSGDGKVVRAAAESGLKVVGYELNPLLYLFSRWRLRRYIRTGQVKLVWGNFWRKQWPPADGIFVFLLNPYMAKLDNKIVQEVGKPVKVVSFAFQIPGRRPSRETKGLYLYNYKR